MQKFERIHLERKRYMRVGEGKLLIFGLQLVKSPNRCKRGQTLLFMHLIPSSLTLYELYFTNNTSSWRLDSFGCVCVLEYLFKLCIVLFVEIDDSCLLQTLLAGNTSYSELN